MSERGNQMQNKIFQTHKQTSDIFFHLEVRSLCLQIGKISKLKFKSFENAKAFNSIDIIILLFLRLGELPRITFLNKGYKITKVRNFQSICYARPR